MAGPDFFTALAARLASRSASPREPWWEDFRPSLRPAAVLVPLFLGPAREVRVLLTQRSAELRNHAGQISFPGGSVAEGDRDRAATALREAQEEVGLQPADCQILGRLDETPIISRFEVTPIVARIPDVYAFTPAAGEVTRLIDLPLRGLLDEGVLEVQTREAFGRAHRVLYYRLLGEEVWGATAGILEQLLTIAGPLL